MKDKSDIENKEGHSLTHRFDYSIFKNLPDRISSSSSIRVCLSSWFIQLASGSPFVGLVEHFSVAHYSNNSVRSCAPHDIAFVVCGYFSLKVTTSTFLFIPHSIWCSPSGNTEHSRIQTRHHPIRVSASAPCSSPSHVASCNMYHTIQLSSHFPVRI